MKYKINRLDLLFALYKIEDKRQYNCKNITKYINKLQKRSGKSVNNGKFKI